MRTFLTRCMSLVTLLALSLPTMAQSTFKYSVTDGKDIKLGGGELRLGGDEKVGLEIGGVKTEVSDGGKKVNLIASTKTDVSWLSESGTISAQTVVDPAGETVVRGFDKSGAPSYQVTGNTDGSRKIEVFKDGKVAYVFSISIDGGFSLSTKSATSPPPATKPTAPVTKQTSATNNKATPPSKPAAKTKSQPPTTTIPANIQVINNSPPPLP